MTKDILEFIGMIGYLIASNLVGFIFYLLKILLIVMIIIGAFNSMQSAPYQFINDAQEFSSFTNNQFIGSSLLVWLSQSWFQLIMIIILFKIINISRSLSTITQTSGHAAYSSTAIANYLKISPSSQRQLNAIKEKGNLSFVDIIKDVLIQRVESWFTGVPFLPDDVIPERNGESVSLGKDMVKILKTN